MAPGVDALGRCHGPEQVGNLGEPLIFGFFCVFNQTLVCLGFADKCIMDIVERFVLSLFVPFRLLSRAMNIWGPFLNYFGFNFYRIR